MGSPGSPFNRPGIYTITFPTGARYVGSAVNLRKRWHGHKTELRRGTHKNGRLKRSWNTHGESNALFAAIIFCSKENLLIYEQLALNALRPGLNICLIAGNALGVKWTEEARARISAKRSGVKLTPEHRSAIGAAHLGQKRTLEARAAMKASQERRKGWKHTEETKARMKGRKIGEDTRLLMKANSTGNKHRLGSTLPAELRQQISAKLKGRKLPMSTRLKMSAARKPKGQFSLF